MVMLASGLVVDHLSFSGLLSNAKEYFGPMDYPRDKPQINCYHSF
jgi:hypothetical protein